MVRSTWKNYFIDFALIKQLKQQKKVFYIWSRRSTIIESFVNKIVFVYNGKKFDKLIITPEMIGFKFGDFIFTKKRGKIIHKIIKTKKKSKK